MLQQRIAIRREYLARNEYPTRQLLVDPLLEELGWDFKDSRRVILEFPVGRLRIDYVLEIDGMAKVAVEAKRYGSRLTGKATQQVLGYARKASIRYAVITDGVRWLMFDAFRATPESNPIVELDLESMKASTVARKAHRLSYQTIESERWVKG